MTYMSHTEAPITVTFKSAKQTLITVRAETAEQFADLIAQGVTVLADAVGEAENAIAEVVGSPSVSVAAPRTQVTKAEAIETAVQKLGAIVVSESAAGPNPGSPDRFCVHGRMNRLEGMGQYGLYKGFFCPSPKGATDKCKTQYVKKNEAEYENFYADKK